MTPTPRRVIAMRILARTLLNALIVFGIAAAATHLHDPLRLALYGLSATCGFLALHYLDQASGYWQGYIAALRDLELHARERNATHCRCGTFPLPPDVHLTADRIHTARACPRHKAAA